MEMGGVLRNAYGEALLVYSRKIDKGINNMDEAMALFWGSQVIKDM